MLGLALGLAMMLAAPQAPPPAGDAGTSRAPLVPLDQIRRALEQPPPQLVLAIEGNGVMFRSRATRPIGASGKDYLRELFALTPIQQQSADWAARGQGVNLLALADGIRNAFRENEARRIHSEIERQLEALKRANEAAGK
jgi:hypothetical protein